MYTIISFFLIKFQALLPPYKTLTFLSGQGSCSPPHPRLVDMSAKNEEFFGRLPLGVMSAIAWVTLGLYAASLVSHMPTLHCARNKRQNR